MKSLEPADLDRFRNVVGSHLGLQFDNGKKELLADVLRQRLQNHECASAARYLESIASGGREEWRALATHLTVTETYFFRGPDQFRALAETALPERIRARNQGKRWRFLSAGCASGEEAYTIAILLRERFPELSRGEVEILGIDLNPAMIAKAREARYHAWSLRETSGELRDKYFRMQGSDFLLCGDVRSAVAFEEGNVALGDLRSLGPFDVILCRNVIMYLLPGAMQRAIGQLTEALLPEGFLFLGYAESLRGLSRDFYLRHTNGTFYYQKVGGGGPALTLEELRPQTTAPPSPNFLDTAWMDAVQQASERIDGLSRASGVGTDLERNGVQPRGDKKLRGQSALPLSLAFELLHQEKFKEALEVLHGLTAEVNGDADARLLQAALLTNCGEIEAAEALCRQVLRADDLNAGAHYLTALCRERAADLYGAMEHDRAAIYLDGTFAMPHLHLGRLAQRCGDLGTARRELEYACLLLLREDPSRLLLFGGGFNREALMAFSQAELRACAGLI